MSQKRDPAVLSLEAPYHFYEKSFDEIGAELGISKQRAEAIYYKAIQKIRASGLLNEFADMIAQTRQ